MSKLTLTIDVDSAKGRAELKQVGTEVKKVGDAGEKSFKKMGKSIGDFNNAAERSIKSMAAFAVQMASVAVSVAAAAKSFNEFSKFEGTTSAWGKVDVKNIDEMRKAMERMPPIYGKMEEMAAGYYQILAFGIPQGEQANEILLKSAQATKVAREETLKHSDVIKGALKFMAGFRGDIDNVTVAFDKLFRVEQIAETNFAELIPEIGDMANMAKLAGMSVNEMGGAFTIVAKTAANTSQAATQFNALAKGMIKPVSELANVFEDMGVASGKALIEQYGLVGALEKMMAQAQKSGKTLDQLFDDKEAMLAVGALAGNIGELEARIKDMGDSAGSLETAWEAWTKTAEASKERFDNSINRTFIQFGTMIAPAFVAGMDAISGALENTELNIAAFGRMWEEAGEGGQLMLVDLRYAWDVFNLAMIEGLNTAVGWIKKGFIGIETSGKLVFELLVTHIRKSFAVIQEIVAGAMTAAGKALSLAGDDQGAVKMFTMAAQWRQSAKSAEGYGETVKRVMAQGLDAMRAVDAETEKNIALGRQMAGISGDIEKTHAENTAAVLKASLASEEAYQKETAAILKGAEVRKEAAKEVAAVEVEEAASAAKQIGVIDEAARKKAEKEAAKAAKAAEKARKEEEKRLKALEKANKEDHLTGGAEAAARRSREIIFEQEQARIEAEKRIDEELWLMRATSQEKELKRFEDGLAAELDAFRKAGADKTKIAMLEADRRAEYEKEKNRESAAQMQAFYTQAFGDVFSLVISGWDGMSADMQASLSGLAGALGTDLGAMFKGGGFSFENLGAFISENKEALANTAEALAKSWHDREGQTDTQNKLDAIFDAVGGYGYIGSLINAGWNAGRGMTQRSQGTMVAGGRIVEVGDISTGDYAADPAMTYAMQKLTGDQYYRTGGQQLSAGIKTDDWSLAGKAGGKAVAEWIDPAGSLLHGYLAEKGGWAGETINDIFAAGGIGGALFNSSSFNKISGLNKENYYRLSDIAPQLGALGQQGWSREGGMAVLDEEQRGDHWFDQISATYKSGLNHVTAAFHEQALARIEVLPEQYGDRLEAMLGNADYSITDISGRTNVKDFKEATTQRLQEYADKLGAILDTATVNIVNEYITAGGEIGFDKLTMDARQSLMAKQYAQRDEAGNEITDEAGNVAYMGASETAMKRLEEMRLIEETWGQIIGSLNGALAEGATAYEMRMTELGESFTMQLDVLSALGFSESALTEIREKQAAVLEKENAAFAEQRAAIIRQVSGTKEATTTADKLTEQLRQLGAVAGDYAQLEAALAGEREKIFSGIASARAPLSAVESVISAVNSEFDEHRQKIIDLGGGQKDLLRLEQERISDVKFRMGQLADTISAKFEETRKSMAEAKFMAGGGTSAGFTMSLLQAKMETPVSSYETLSSAADLLVTWRQQAIQEAEQSAQNMAGSVGQTVSQAGAVADQFAAVAKAIESLVDAVEQTIQSIKYSDLNVGLDREKRFEAQKDYAALKSAAETGGEKEIQEFLGFAQTYLQTAKNDLASSQAYQDLYAGTMADLEDMKGRLRAGQYNDRLTVAGASQSSSGVSGGYGGATTGGGMSVAEINEQFEALAASIESKMAQITEIEAVLNINWSGLEGDAATAISLIKDITDKYGWDHPATIRFMGEFVQNFEGTLETKMQALGYIAGQAGWESRATMEFVSNLASIGASWSDIQAEMDRAGVGADIITNVKFNFEYDVSRWQQDVQALIDQGVGYTKSDSFGTKTVVAPNLVQYQGNSGQSFTYNASSNLQTLASQYTDVAQMLPGYSNQPAAPAIDIDAINAKYPAFDLTSLKVAQEMADRFRYPKSMLEDMLGPSYYSWHSDMEKVFQYHGLPAPPYATGGIINRVLVPDGDDGLIGARIGEGVVSQAGMAALERLNSGDVGNRDEVLAEMRIQNGLLRQLIAKETGVEVNVEVPLRYERLRPVVEDIAEDVVMERAERKPRGRVYS